MVAVIVKIHA